jgi:hypothetical protein
MISSLLILIWWVAASRATWRERLFGFVGLIAGAALTVLLAHPTMRGPGTMHYTAPMGLTLFVLAAVLLKGSRPAWRTGMAVLLALPGFAFSTLVQNEGMTGEYEMTLHWRWTPTAEERMLAARASEMAGG